jgi:hypothetical protein
MRWIAAAPRVIRALRSGMSTPLFSRVCQILHLLALAVWLGSVAMSGVVAAIVFPLMGTLEPTLATYPSYEGNHATLTAGLVASKVFFTVDTIQFVCASLALGTMVVLIARGYSLNTLTRVFRVIFLCMTLALLSYHLFFFMPTLTRTLNGYWDFAKMGNTAQAIPRARTTRAGSRTSPSSSPRSRPPRSGVPVGWPMRCKSTTPTPTASSTTAPPTSC